MRKILPIFLGFITFLIIGCTIPPLTESARATATMQAIFDQHKELGLIVNKVCSGEGGIPTAAPYIQQSGIHPVIDPGVLIDLFTIKRMEADPTLGIKLPEKPANSFVRDSWLASDINSAELVFCGFAWVETKDILVETCDYNAIFSGEKKQLKMYKTSYTFTLRELQTGEIVATTDALTSDDPGSCPLEIEFEEGQNVIKRETELSGDELKREVDKWLEPLVVIP